MTTNANPSCIASTFKYGKEVMSELVELSTNMPPALKSSFRSSIKKAQVHKLTIDLYETRQTNARAAPHLRNV